MKNAHFLRYSFVHRNWEEGALLKKQFLPNLKQGLPEEREQRAPRDAFDLNLNVTLPHGLGQMENLVNLSL